MDDASETVVYKDASGDVIQGLPTNAGVYTVEYSVSKTGYVTVNKTATVTINQKKVTITVADASKQFNKADPTFGFAEDGEPALVNENDLGTITFTREAGEDVKDYGKIIDASYTPNGNYDVTVNKGNFEITTNTTDLTASAENVNVDYDGFTHEITVVKSIDDASETVVYKDANGDEIQGLPTNAGVYTAEYSVSKTGYATVNKTATVTINKKAVTITVADASKQFNKADPDFGYAINGQPDLVNTGDLGEITFTRTNDSEAVGTYNNVITARFTENDNYEVEVNNGDFRIVTNTTDLTANADNVDVVYDGLTHEITVVKSIADASETVVYKDVSGDEIEGLPTNAGTYTAEYSVSKTGYATVSSEAVVVIRRKALAVNGLSDTVTYNGEVQSVAGFISNGLVNTEQTIEATHEISGKNARTYTGTITDANDVVVTDNDGNDVTNNYIITTNPGTLTINPINTLITITAGSSSHEYDGEIYFDPTYSYTEFVLADGDRLEAYTSGSITNVGTTTNEISGYAVFDGDENVTENYRFALPVNGSIEVTPKDASLTIANLTKTAGEADPTFTAIVAGLVDGETLDYTLSRTPGETIGTYPITASIVNNPNYNLNIIDGQLTINTAPIIIPVTPPTTPTPNTLTTPTTTVTTILDQVGDTQVPLDDGAAQQQIEETTTPLGTITGTWALVNLIFAMSTVLLGFFLVISKRNKEEENEEDETVEAFKRRRWTKVLAVVVGILSVIAFVLTENMNLPISLVDEWTLMMAVGLAIQTVTYLLGRKWKDDDDGEEVSTQTV